MDFMGYLEEYDYKGKSSLDQYIMEHKSVFENNCRRLRYKQRSGAVADITTLLDWSSDQLDYFSKLSFTYSGVVTTYPEIIPKKSDAHFDLARRSFSELEKYNDPEEKCPISWVTATIRVAEASLGNKVALSAEQLFECLPEVYSVDKCGGVHPTKISEYLMEVGLMGAKDFTDCKSIDSDKTYHFMPTYPEYPNAGGLMNMIAENGIAFAMLAVDINKLQFVKDMSDYPKGVKCGGYDPSLYGIVTGYYYDEQNINDSWWEVSAHIVPGEEVRMKIPMIANMENANYAGIAAYAFVLTNAHFDDNTPEPTTDVPTSEIPTTEISTTEAPTTGASTTEAPTSVVPTTKTPTTEMPTTEVPTTEVPTTDASTTEAPTTVVPTTVLPTTQTPTTEMPTTEMPTTEVPTTEMPTTEIPTTPAPVVVCGDDLIISDDSECDKLFETGWKTITVNEGLCNALTEDWEVTNYDCLQKLVVKKNSLQNLHSLKISDNPQLKVIEIEDGDNYSMRRLEDNSGAFNNVTSVVIESSLSLIC